MQAVDQTAKFKEKLATSHKEMDTLRSELLAVKEELAQRDHRLAEQAELVCVTLVLYGLFESYGALADQ